MGMDAFITMTSDWINSIYFRIIQARYRVLNRGYIGNPAERKIRNVVKNIIQSQSPCLDRRHMVCRECSRKQDCLFFRLAVDQVEFGPYIVHVAEPEDWRGAMEPGKELNFDIRLIGRKSGLADQITECLRHKPFFSFDAAADERVRFELVSVDDMHGGGEISVEDLIEDYKSRSAWDGGAVSELRIEFVTPVEIRKKDRIIKNPDDMTFEVFLGALLERINGIARAHCGFEGKTPSLEDVFAPEADVLTDNSGLSFTSRKPRRKGRRSENKSKEYFGGLKGAIRFTGDFTPYFPMILLGEALHIGKKTTQGLGHYVIKELNSRAVFPAPG